MAGTRIPLNADDISALLDQALQRRPDAAQLSTKSIEELLSEISIYHEELRYQNEELRRIQEDLERSRNRYKALFDGAPAGYLVLDRHLAIEESNEIFRIMMHLDELALRGHRVSDFVSREDQDQFYFFTRSFLIPGNRAECRVSLVTGEGEKLPVRMAGSPDKGGTEGQVLLAVMDISAEVGASRKSERTESLIHSTMVGMGEGMIVADRDLRITRMNPQAELMTGWKEHEVIGKPLSEVYRLVETGTQKRVDSHYGASMTGAVIRRDDNSVSLLRRSGETIPVRDTMTSVKASAGNALGLVVLFTDMSESFVTMSRISEARGLFRTLFHVNPLPTALIRLSDYTFIDVNAAFAGVFGHDASTLIGKASYQFDLWSSDAVSGHLSRLGKDTASVHGLQTQGRHKDGRIKDILAYLETITIEGDLYALCTFVDISDLLTARSELENERILLRTIIGAMPDMVWLKSLSGTYLVCNARFEEFCGEKESRIVGRTDSDLHDPDVASIFEAKDREAAQTGKPVMHSQWVTFPSDGRSVLLEIIRVPILDASGALVGVLGIAHDITQRKQAEDTILRLNVSLEQRVEDRTAALLSANRELEAFAYSVSHDLRAPLRAINGFAHILLQNHTDRLDPEGLRLATVIRESATRMGKLIDDLLAFSRLGRTEMHVYPIDMQALAAEIYGELIHEAEKSGRPPTTEFRLSDLPQAVGDPAMIRQVWVNLLSNAIKFTGKHEHPLIEVFWETEGSSGHYVVRDNGAGFDMAYSSKLFGVFQRLHGVKEFEGTGVGLALVQRILQRHGGSISAWGQPQVGAIFKFRVGTKPGTGTRPA